MKTRDVLTFILLAAALLLSTGCISGGRGGPLEIDPETGEVISY